MNNDIQKYPIFKLEQGGLKRIYWIKSTDDYCHTSYSLHHFIEKKIRKSDKEFYERVEPLQKLILIPPKLNLEIATMDEKRFKLQWGIDKAKVLFNRKLWRSNYYEL